VLLFVTEKIVVSSCFFWQYCNAAATMLSTTVSSNDFGLNQNVRSKFMDFKVDAIARRFAIYRDQHVHDSSTSWPKRRMRTIVETENKNEKKTRCIPIFL
jgi:hypothetical protein